MNGALGATAGTRSPLVDEPTAVLAVAPSASVPNGSPSVNPAGALDSLTYFCANCALEWDEGFCGQCGARLRVAA